MSDNSTVTRERRGHVLLLGLNRPEKKNAFNLAMLAELSHAYREYEDDPELRCAVLHAHGDSFTSGLDLAEVGPAVASGDPLFPEGGIDPLDLAAPRRTKPVVAAIKGWCLTIGIELLLASDIRVCAEGTRFRQMEVNRGIMPFGGATLRMPALTGWGNAMRWILTGDELGAAEALRVGWVQEVTPLGQELDRAVAIAESVAKRAPLAVVATRSSCLLAAERGFDAGLTGMMEEARRLLGTEDAVEGMRSFVERREARFTGK